MKFRIQSRVKSIQQDQLSEQVKTKRIFVNVVLEFDHHPSGDEIQTAIASLPKYQACNIRFLETLTIQRLPE